MKIQISVITIVITFLGTSLVCAEMNQKAEALLSQYVEAFQTNDSVMLDEAYQQIANDLTILNYIKENHKHEYSLLRLQNISQRIDSMESRYGNGLPVKASQKSTNLKFKKTNFSGTKNVPSSLRGNQANNFKTSQSPNQDRPSNVKRSQRSNSKIRRTNSDTVRSYSNNLRARKQSNQRRLRARR